MGEKSIQKKQFILKKAREVFCRKGFKEVTMKDIVEACEISRGGLYLYFNNVSEIFREVMFAESEDTDDVFSQAITEEATSADILALFLQEQKKELLRKGDNLCKAVYEYYFAHRMPRKENLYKKQFDGAVKIIEKLIENGAEEGEFICADPAGAARNIMYVLEGLRIISQTIGITEETVNRELLYIMQGITVD